mmetsp:Transcript_41231/g.89336  ORF Transcript_41231/g.89336 Transcript_41231/m.89336 type:complete len:90 (-) Transcript_41231:147-416(-)
MGEGRKSSSLRCACCHCGMPQLGAFLDHCRVQAPEELPDHSLLRSTLVSFFQLLRVCFVFFWQVDPAGTCWCPFLATAQRADIPASSLG